MPSPVEKVELAPRVSRSVELLKNLPGVYVSFDPDGFFGDNPAAIEFSRKAIATMGAILQNGGIEVLPALAELESTPGHPILTFGGILMESDEAVIGVVTLHLTEWLRLQREPYIDCFATTWEQFAIFDYPDARDPRFFLELGSEMRTLVDMFLDDYQKANPRS